MYEQLGHVRLLSKVLHMFFTAYVLGNESLDLPYLCMTNSNQSLSIVLTHTEDSLIVICWHNHRVYCPSHGAHKADCPMFTVPSRSFLFDFTRISKTFHTIWHILSVVQ